MNELDSELVTGQLRALGYGFTPDAGAADVVLYNTCSVREHAEQKVWSRLGELALRKAAEPGLVVGVLGCMAEREGTGLMKRMPVVDLMVGPAELDKLPGLLDNALATRRSLAADADGVLSAPRRPAGLAALHGDTNRRSSTLAAAADQLELLDLSRSTAPDDHAGSAYVRITRGCNKFCTYCVVPFTRGAEVHRPPDHIVDECKRLADAGVIEVTLLGQTVNHYRFEHGAAVTVGGIVQPQKGRAHGSRPAGGGAPDPLAGTNVTTFADLLARIHDEVPAIRRLRFVTSYPRSFGDDILAVMRDSPRICRYLHAPAQSGSDRMLRAMNRGYTVAEYTDFLDRARAALHQPEIGRPLTLAGDIIVGFPGETEEDHRQTAELLERAQYKNCFIFKYSARPGTVAHDKLPDDVPEEVKRRRNSELLALQNRISDAVSRSYVGAELEVFIQGVSKRQEKRAAPSEALGHPGHGAGVVPLTISGARPGRPALAAGGDAGADAGVDGSEACARVATAAAAPDADGGSEPVQLAARTDGDLIVFIDAPSRGVGAGLIGTIRRVRIERASGLSLHAALL